MKTQLKTFNEFVNEGIIDKIKDFLEIALSNPYTHKIKILDVHVNREIYQPKQYRYLGGVIRIDRKKKQEYIQYLKHGMHHLITKDSI